MNNVTVVILAAGTGKRFWPFTTNKSLFPFLGKPLVQINLERLHEAGFGQAIVVINPADVPSYLDIQVPGMDVKTVIQQEARGMGDALLRVREHVRNTPILVVNAEDMVDPSLYKDLFQKTSQGVSFLTGKKVTSYFDGGYLKTEDKRVVGIVEKPGEGNEPSNLVNLVFHFIHEPDTFFTILEGQTSDRDDVYERALDAYLQQSAVSLVPYNGPWHHMKYPWHVLEMMDYFLNTSLKEHRGENIQIADSAVLEGPIHIEDNVRIFDNTKIVGPTYIGKGTIIGDQNMIRHSYIGSDCVTGFCSDITRSYIGSKSWFHTNYIGDSVIEGNVSMGSGSVLANLRLDEGEISSVVQENKYGTGRTKLGAMIGRYVRIGVNSSIMPGVKIGADSFIGAGITVTHDIPEESFVTAQTKLEISKNTKSVRELSREAYKKDISS